MEYAKKLHVLNGQTHYKGSFSFSIIQDRATTHHDNIAVVIDMKFGQQHEHFIKKMMDYLTLFLDSKYIEVTKNISDQSGLHVEFYYLASDVDAVHKCDSIIAAMVRRAMEIYSNTVFPIRFTYNTNSTAANWERFYSGYLT